MPGIMDIVNVPLCTDNECFQERNLQEGIMLLNVHRNRMI